MRPVLCMVTDRHRLARLRSGSVGEVDTAGAENAEDALVRCVAGAARAGVDLVQVRERDLEGGALTRLAGRCVEAVRGTRSRVLVNDRLDVALAAGAHGVHLPGHGFSAARARAVAPRGFLIGRSVHHATEAARVAEEGGLDYLIFGTVFPTSSKIGVATAGVEGLAAAVASVRIPVLAIGGVTLEHAAAIARTGAAGAAAIGMFADPTMDDIDRLDALVAQWARRW